VRAEEGNGAEQVHGAPDGARRAAGSQS
jgi:hypothetical protein